MPNSPLRWTAATAALVLCLLGATACTATPQPQEADLNTGAEAHAALVAAAQSAASATGSSSEVTKDAAVACPLGDGDFGAQFHYIVSVPADTYSPETYAKVAETWNALGIKAAVQNGSVHVAADAQGESPLLGPMVMTHFEARGEFKAQYTIEGRSLCLPGSPGDYKSLTSM